MKLRPFGQRHRPGLNALAIPDDSNQGPPDDGHSPSPLRVPKERSDLLPDGNPAPTTVAVAAAMAISPHTQSCGITRIGYDHSGSAAGGFIHRRYWCCWVPAAVLVPIAATA